MIIHITNTDFSGDQYIVILCPYCTPNSGGHQRECPNYKEVFTLRSRKYTLKDIIRFKEY